MIDENILFKGWGYERSSILRRWKRRWLLLLNEAFFTYKRIDDTIPRTRLILSDVTGISKILKTKHSIIQIITRNLNCLIYTETEEIIEKIYNQLMILKPQLVPVNQTNLSKQEIVCRSDEILIQSFNSIKSALVDREKELLALNDAHYKQFKVDISEDALEFTRECDSYKSQHSEIQAIIAESSPTIDKIREIQKIAMNSACEETIEDSVISYSLHLTTRPLEKCLLNCAVVELSNPNEHQIRRSRITRALKWRYSGDKLDALTFVVSENIYLTALGLCRPYKQGEQILLKQFNVLKGMSTNCKSIYTHSTQLYIESHNFNSVAKLSLNHGVVVKKNTPYTVVFWLEGSPSYKCVDCENKFLAPDLVLWKFSTTTFAVGHKNNKSDDMCGPIADFYYIRIAS